MFGKSSLGRIPRMFVQVDQLFDSEGPLGVALAIADSRESSSAREAARHLEQTHRLLKADSIRDLESLVDPAMKVHTLNHIDRAIEALRQLREELKSERCSDEVGALARARRRLKCLRCQVVRLPFAAESGAAKDLEYVCHMQSWRWLRAVGVLVAIVATGILPAILAIIAWSLYKHQCPKETLDNLLFGRTGICYLIEDRYCDQKERALYSIDMEDRLLSYEERMQMIADWAWDFGIDLGRDAKDWYACVNNFPRFIELRTHIRSYAERLQVGRIMRAEASMLKWSEDRLPCPCCAQPEPIPVEEADEEAVQDDTAEELAAAAAFTAAAAVAAQSYDEPEEEEEEEDSDVFEMEDEESESPAEEASDAWEEPEEQAMDSLVPEEAVAEPVPELGLEDEKRMEAQEEAAELEDEGDEAEEDSDDEDDWDSDEDDEDDWEEELEEEDEHRDQN